MVRGIEGKPVAPYTMEELRTIAYEHSAFGDVKRLSAILFDELESELELGISDGKEEFIEAILEAQHEQGLVPVEAERAPR